MKRLLIGLALFGSACTGSMPTLPSSSTENRQTTQAPAEPAAGPATATPTVDPSPGPPGANASVPQFTLSGPRDPLNCFTAGTSPMQWVLNVTDAGPRALRFVALAHQDDTPGCGATSKNPRARIEMSGVTEYTPHSSGQTVFTFDPKLYSCGRVQVDVSIFDAAGNEILVVGVVINYGTQCTPPPSSLICVPPAQTVLIGQPANFSATGGTGTYSWSTPSGAPVSGSGSAFMTTYASAGAYIATVTSGGATATCQVNVLPTITVELTCMPPTQTVGIGQVATVTAAGGTGTYSWSAPGGATPTGAGASFNTTYPSAGTNTITVTSGAQTATCQVIVPPPPPSLVCAPPTQTVAIGAPAAVTATGGTGTYSWSAPGGSTPTGAGASFSTTYPGAGTNMITVTSGAQTATCQVIVPPPPPSLVCAPPTQTVAIGAPAAVTATGGTGTYGWSAPGGSTPTGTGASFSTSYPAAGTNTITVTSGAQTATCQVVVPPPPPTLVCTPPTQTVFVGAPATVGATGGTGTYSWAAPGGSMTTGSGSPFTTSYGAPGTNTITVTSGAQTATCAVTVVSPPCEVVNPPTFTATYPIGGVGGSANVRNAGVWTLRLFAAATLAQYTNDQPDYQKATVTRTLLCGDSATMNINYNWQGHQDVYWWMVLERNGTRVFKSQVAIRP